jgi:hypothetical protein
VFDHPMFSQDKGFVLSDYRWIATTDDEGNVRR